MCVAYIHVHTNEKGGERKRQTDRQDSTSMCAHVVVSMWRSGQLMEDDSLLPQCGSWLVLSRVSGPINKMILFNYFVF